MKNQRYAIQILESMRTIYENTMNTDLQGVQLLMGLDNDCQYWLTYDRYGEFDYWRVLKYNNGTVLFESDDIASMSEYLMFGDD